MTYVPYTERFGPIETELSEAVQAHKVNCQKALDEVDQALARLSGEGLSDG